MGVELDDLCSVDRNVPVREIRVVMPGPRLDLTRRYVNRMRVGRFVISLRPVDNDGEMEVAVAGRDLDACQDILAGMKLHLEETEKQYPNNLKVIITEV